MFFGRKLFIFNENVTQSAVTCWQKYSGVGRGAVTARIAVIGKMFEEIATRLEMRLFFCCTIAKRPLKLPVTGSPKGLCV